MEARHSLHYTDGCRLVNSKRTTLINRRW